MAEKSVAEKLQFKPGRKVYLVNAPEQVGSWLGSIPDEVTISHDALIPVDVIVAFVRERKELEAELKRLRDLLGTNGILWVAYYKGTARIKTDINRDTINAYAQSLGMQGVAMISINEDWSALRLKLV
jgi:hypothetical protein